jgi:hypothetical protein
VTFCFVFCDNVGGLKEEALASVRRLLLLLLVFTVLSSGNDMHDRVPKLLRF